MSKNNKSLPESGRSKTNKRKRGNHMNEKTKVQVQGVPETMLQTLYARAQESKKPNHHIYDERAIEVVSRLDYDFSKAESDKAMSLGVIARTIVLDKLVGDFLSHYPRAVVLNIACGMDTRCYRMEGKYAGITLICRRRWQFGVVSSRSRGRSSRLQNRLWTQAIWKTSSIMASRCW